MKKILPYLLLFTYSMIMLKPVMPYIIDGVAHILNFKDHMATVHAHHGKYHVHTEIAEAAKNDNTEKNTDNILKKTASGNEHVIAKKADSFPIQQSIHKYSAILPVNIAGIYLSSDFPPPKGQPLIFLNSTILPAV